MAPRVITLVLAAIGLIGLPSFAAAGSPRPPAAAPAITSDVPPSNGPETFVLSANPPSASICVGGDSVQTTVDLTRAGELGGVTLAALGLPAGASSVFGTNPISGTLTSSTLMISGLGATPVGSYTAVISGTASSGVHTTPFSIEVLGAVPGAPTLLGPTVGATNVTLRPTFSWSTAPNATRYILEVALDPAFTNLVAGTDTGLTSNRPEGELSPSTSYYWRVRPLNPCGPGTPSAVATFTTEFPIGACQIGRVQKTIYRDNFEANSSQWTSGGLQSTWAITSTRSAYWAQGTPATSDQFLVSPPITIPAASAATSPTLQFENLQTIQRDGPDACFDGAFVEVSTNNGTTWTQFPGNRLLSDPYDGPITGGLGNPAAGRQAWCGDPQDWLNSVVDLRDYAGQSVRFRFRLATNSSIGSEGWLIDDVRVRACEPGTPPVFTSAPPTTAFVGQPFSHTFAASGNPAVTYTIQSGSLPAWLTFNATTGVLSGTPPRLGTFGPYIVTATNGAVPDATQPFTLVIRQNLFLPAMRRD
jgi:hypothetical protein